MEFENYKKYGKCVALRKGGKKDVDNRRPGTENYLLRI